MSEDRRPRETGEPPEWLVGFYRLMGRSDVQARWQARKLVAKLSARDEGPAPPRERSPRRQRGHTAHALGLVVPSFISVSSVIGLMLIAVYLRMMIANPKSGYLSWPVDVLVRFGANIGPAVFEANQYWRLLTAIFLHIGLIHLGFNLFALSQIGPMVEGVFGRARTLFLFMATGLLGSLASAYLHDFAISAGASGAIMGLVGVAAGWGQRAGTTQAREVRNHMLKWAAYTVLFGMLVGADHAAHAGGFVSGGLLGLLLRPGALEARRHKVTAALMGAIGALLALVGFLLAIRPPLASLQFAEPFRRPVEIFADPKQGPPVGDGAE